VRRWLALAPMHDKVTVINAAIPDLDHDPIIINQDTDWCIDEGTRSAAYSALIDSAASTSETARSTLLSSGRAPYVVEAWPSSAC